jgi:hypothetical protein
MHIAGIRAPSIRAAARQFSIKHAALANQVRPVLSTLEHAKNHDGRNHAP